MLAVTGYAVEHIAAVDLVDLVAERLTVLKIEMGRRGIVVAVAVVVVVVVDIGGSVVVADREK